MSDKEFNCSICQKEIYMEKCADCIITYCDKCFEEHLNTFCLVCCQIFCEDCSYKQKIICQKCQKN
jgi:hypothetical protein